MPTTTNYGWTTPADTDLVKDGASAIRTLGSAIDTTVFNNASAAIAKTIVDAKGDLIAATAADTVARLAVGTDGQYLQADSSTSTGLKWGTVSAGGMTEIASGNLSTASVSITSIPSTYKNLQLVVRDFANTTGADYLRVRFNASTSTIFGDISFTATSEATVATSNHIRAARYNNSTDSIMILNCYDYADTTAHKTGEAQGWGYDGSSSGDLYHRFWAYRSTNAISSIQLSFDAGYTFSAGTYVLYGVK